MVYGYFARIIIISWQCLGSHVSYCHDDSHQFLHAWMVAMAILGATVEPVNYGHLGTSKKCPDYQGVQVILYEKVPFGSSTKCLDYAGVHIFKCPY